MTHCILNVGVLRTLVPGYSVSDNVRCGHPTVPRTTVLSLQHAASFSRRDVGHPPLEAEHVGYQRPSTLGRHVARRFGCSSRILPIQRECPMDDVLAVRVRRDSRRVLVQADTGRSNLQMARKRARRLLQRAAVFGVEAQGGKEVALASASEHRAACFFFVWVSVVRLLPHTYTRHTRTH